MVASCALRDTFFAHPASVCPGPPKTLTHRAQAGGDVRGPPRAEPAIANAPARAPRPKRQAATPSSWLGWGLLSEFAPERRVLHRFLLPQRIGRAPYRPTGFLLNVVVVRHLLAAAIRANLREFRP